MAQEGSDPIERWTAKRRMALVVSILKGDTSVAEAARQHGLTVAEVEEWREKFLLGAENALRTRPKDEDAVKDEQIKTLCKLPCQRDTITGELPASRWARYMAGGRPASAS